MQSNSSSDGLNTKKIRQIDAFALLKDRQTSIFNNLGNGFNNVNLAKMDDLITQNLESTSHEQEKKSKTSSIKSSNNLDDPARKL